MRAHSRAAKGEELVSKYEYVKRPAGSPWLMEVRIGASHKGNIRKSPVTGRYQFFRGSVNVIRCSLEESDMELLIEKIEELNL
jgi:hypothetical protein